MPIIDFISSLLTSAGPGGLIVLAVIGLAATIYFLLIRWILKGGEEDSDKPYFQ